MVSPIKILDTVGVSVTDILNRKHNLWIGVSLDNEWFTEENITRLINFALEHTKDSVLVLIPGQIQSINFRYFDKLNRSDALRKAFALEDAKKQMIAGIISKLPPEQRDKVQIANYGNICTLRFIFQQELIFRAYAEQGEFYQRVMEMAEESLEARGRTVSKERAESVALYVLEELPLFLDGLRLNGNELVYTTLLYPGTGKLDYLINDILHADSFAALRQKLRVEKQTGIVNVE